MFSGFEVFGIFVGSYGLVALAGIFIAFPPAILFYKKQTGAGIDDMFITLMCAGCGALLGMHLLFGITNIEYWHILFEATDIPDFFNRFVAVFGGSVFYGGLLGAIAGGMIYMKACKLPVRTMSDYIAPSAALFHCFGRIGCFLSGCCYGVESEHGIVFHDSVVEAANGVPRVPVQLYEAAFDLVLAAVLWLLLWKKLLKGKLFLLYLIAYAPARFILEFWRGDEYRGFLFGLSTSQLISILILAAAVPMCIFSRSEPEESTQAPSP